MAVGLMATGSGHANLKLTVAAGELVVTPGEVGTGPRAEAGRLSRHLDVRQLRASRGLTPHASISL